MIFSSIFFIFTFLPIVILFYILIPKAFKNVYLLICSLIFYAWGEPVFVWLLLLMIGCTYFMGRRIANATGKKRKALFIEAIFISVFLLFYMKYYGFVIHTIFQIFSLSIPYKISPMPLGISFFTFSIIAYLYDVYTYKIHAERNIINYALFVSFFPKLIMGPISRYAGFQKQLRSHPVRIDKVEKGTRLFLSGLAQKIILANTLSEVWAYASQQSVSGVGAWLGIIAFTFQIYFDFHGYTLMAQGLANVFGFDLEQNFNYPYMACSLTDFWRRWHMTLGAWFRDYVYIPLGGNRTSFLRHLCNLMIVWLLTGLWHGASWNFILWGLYYGVLLIIEKYILCDTLAKCPQSVRRGITLLCVMIGWVLFASNTLQEAIHYFGNMGMMNGFIGSDTAYILQNYGMYLLLGTCLITPYPKRIMGNLSNRMKTEMWYLKPIVTCVLCILLLSYMISNTYQTFLYFKF